VDLVYLYKIIMPQHSDEEDGFAGDLFGVK
jgi:hypothetical protein